MYEFPATVETVETVPEQFRGMYSADEAGAVTLNSALSGVVEALQGMAKANTAARADADLAKASKVDLSPLSSYGTSPQEILEAVEKQLATQSKTGADFKVDLDKMREDMNRQNKAKEDSHIQRNEALTTQLHKLLVKDSTTTAIRDLDGNVDLLTPVVEKHVKIHEENGELRVVVVDESNTARVGLTGMPMTIVELVTELKGKPSFAPCFKSSSPSGPGTPPANASNKHATLDKKDMSPNQKIAAGLAENLAPKAGYG